MSNIEEKAEAYLATKLEDYAAWLMNDEQWTEDNIKEAYAAGYAAAERYRMLLQAAIRNSTPTPLETPNHDD